MNAANNGKASDEAPTCPESPHILETARDKPEFTEEELLQAGYRFALSLCHHREEAEDLVQETWLKLSKSYGGVENQAILFSALRNLFIDQCRRKKIVRFEPVDQEELARIEGDPDQEPCIQGEIGELLAQLNPAEREVIFLHYYQGNTAEEISRFTGQPRGTVLSLLHRSIAKLRTLSNGGKHFARNQILSLFVLSLTLMKAIKP